MLPLAVIMSLNRKNCQKIFKTYQIMSSFTVMITVEIVVSQKMSKSFFKKLFKTTRIMEGLAVMIAVERQPLKKFLFRS